MPFLEWSLLLSLHQTGPKNITINWALNFSTSMLYSKASVSSLLKFNSRNFLLTAKREIRAVGTDAAACRTGVLVTRRAEPGCGYSAREALGNRSTRGLVFQDTSLRMGGRRLRELLLTAGRFAIYSCFLLLYNFARVIMAGAFGY